jgi:tryptophan 7-halogenase
MNTDSPPSIQKPHAIANIVVVGGGSAGWMAAAMLAKCLPKTCRVSVIQPPGQRGIGVGEATIPSILRLLEFFEVDEPTWMRRCQATYKLGIHFVDWNRQGGNYWHPFGVCGARIDQADLFHDWWVQANRFQLKRPYTTYSLHWSAAMAGKSPHSFSGPSPITQTRSYAFHLSATGFADWLHDEAIEAGVIEIEGTLRDVTLSQAETIGCETIDSITLDSGIRVAGDFFIDCTGFESRLMNGALQDPFVDWSDRLLCDSAVAVRLPRGEITPPYTEATALSAGWCWNIPLADSVGCGYVYSSTHQSRDEAWSELAGFTGLIDDETAQPRHLRMRVGRQQSFWRGNVLALGLAAGFMEPLESTGLHLTQVGIEWFLDHFPSIATGSKHADVYNRLMTGLYDEASDFVHLHYLLSKRSDTAFWRAARNTPVSLSLQERLAMYDESGRLGPLMADAFPETSHYHLLTGNDRLPQNVSMMSLAKDPERIKQVLQQIDQQNQMAMRSLPFHEEHLDWVHPVTSEAA